MARPFSRLYARRCMAMRREIGGRVVRSDNMLRLSAWASPLAKPRPEPGRRSIGGVAAPEAQPLGGGWRSGDHCNANQSDWNMRPPSGVRHDPTVSRSTASRARGPFLAGASELANKRIGPRIREDPVHWGQMRAAVMPLLIEQCPQICPERSNIFSKRGAENRTVYNP